MGQIKAAARPKETENEIDATGHFTRQENHFQTPFGNEKNELKPASGKYRLIWAKGCNWSNRASIVIDLLGLEESISVQLVGRESRAVDYGWEFIYGPEHIDPILGVQFLSELYKNGDPEYTGRATVPALVDIQKRAVVNNDYHRLTNYFEVDFEPFHKSGAPDLYPEKLRSEINSFNDWLFHNVNNGVYKCMFAQSITAYEEAFDALYQGLDSLEERLSKQRFLFGDFVTDSDVRFFVTLARFDISYFKNMGPLRGRIVDFPNIWGYARDLYTIPAFKRNTYFRDLAERHGDTSTIFIDYNTRFWNQIDFEKLWSAPQQRAQLSKSLEEKFKKKNEEV